MTIITTPCPVCGEPSTVADHDAPCTHCGRGSWFTWSVDGAKSILRPKKDLTHSTPIDQFLDLVEFEPGDHLVST